MSKASVERKKMGLGGGTGGEGGRVERPVGGGGGGGEGDWGGGAGGEGSRHILTVFAAARKRFGSPGNNSTLLCPPLFAFIPRPA